MTQDLVITKLFSNAASKFSGQISLQIEKDGHWEKISYRDLEALSRKVAAFLIKEGFKKGERSAIILENRPEWAMIYLGMMYAGLVCVPLDPEFCPEEIKNLIGDSETKVVFSSYDLFVNKIKPVIAGSLIKSVVLDAAGKEEKGFYNFSDIKNIPSEDIPWPVLLPQDIASLIYTSGTTGKPKGVLLSHNNLCSNFMSIKKFNLILPSDNFLSILPLYHTYAFMVTLLVPLLGGAKVTYCASFKPEDLARIIKETNVTFLAGVPQLFSLLHKAIFERIKKIPLFFQPFIFPFIKLKLHKQLGSLRILVSGGARLEPNIGRDLFSLGIKVIEGYGLTETSPAVTLNPPQNLKFGSVGKPIPDVQIKIFNPDKEGIGQVLISGPNVMEGYFKHPELTAEVIKDGWFYSGDVGYLDKEGYLFLAGREKEVIVLSSGKNIYPEELEEYYLRSPCIKEICIISREEKSFGHPRDSLYAVIVPDLGFFNQLKKTDIREKIRWDLDTLGKELPSYKHIMGFTVTKEELPRTVLKKIKRYVVREKYIQVKLPEAALKETVFSQEDREILSKDIARKITRYISSEVNKPVYLDSHLEIDLGIDSLSRVELGLGLEALLKIKIPDELLYSIATVKGLITNIENIMKEPGVIMPQLEETQKGWGEILREAPPQEIMGKIKLGFGFLERSLTRLFEGIFSFVFRLFWLLRIEGRRNLPLDGPYLICSNHAGYLDGFFIFSSLPFKISVKTYFLGYQRIFEHPLFGWANKISRLLSIDTATHLTEAMQAVSFVLSQKNIVCIFPEGMRSIDENVKEFKKGVGILLQELNIPVVPVYIQGSHKSWPRGARLPRFHPVKVIFGKPLHRQQLGNDYETIARGLREEVLKLKPL